MTIKSVGPEVGSMLLKVSCLCYAVGKKSSIVHTLDKSWKGMDIKKMIKMMTVSSYPYLQVKKTGCIPKATLRSI